jgi:hypothetical protein
MFSAFCRELLLLAALDWRGVAEFHRSK